MSSEAARARPTSRGAPTDGELVRRVLAGDPDAFEPLVRRHQAELYRYARRLRIEHDPASDLVQDAFVSAYTRLRQCSDPDRFRFWLLRILRNRCLDWLRNVRRNAVSLDDSPVDVLATGDRDAAAAAELRSALERALGSLPIDLRDAFVMKHHEGRSYHEMAEIADASVSAMKMRVHRAREALREQLVEVGVSRPG